MNKNRSTLLSRLSPARLLKPKTLPKPASSLLLSSSYMAAILALSPAAHAQVGQLLWEENFDTLDTEIWNVNEGDGCAIGLCGWGNQELENYRPENVTIESIPGESNNNALVFEAKAETFGSQSFTSGKIDSENGVTMHYGMVETRIRVPDIEGGLWPAFWMLGTSTASWPSKGELDIMEMGHSDSAIASHGFDGTPQNNFVGSNAIFYSADACVVGNETCAASTAYLADNAYVSTTPMNDRFITYRMYWTDTEIRFTAEDNGVEVDMYDNPIPITDESSELRDPFYFLMNLAVGGTFTGLMTPAEITAPLPGKMYIDYIRVYEYNGLGEVTLGNPTQPEGGTFGVFTDLSPTHNALEPGVSSDIYVWNSASVVEGSEAPYEGGNVIAWQYNNPGNWFGGGVQSRQPRDMSGYESGEVSFWIKIPADVSFRIGVTDTYSNQNWVEFPANTDVYGLSRDGEWGKATIPVTDIRGTNIALQSLQYPFAIVSMDGALPTASFDFAIDDILWSGAPIIETVDDGVQYGDVTFTQTDSNSWTSVSFDQAFSAAPIVVVGDASYEGSDPSTFRVRNVTAAGFELQLDEWDYRDGGHVAETASYFAVAEGTHDIDGLQLVAGELNVNNNWQTANYATAFSNTPVVFARQVSNNDTAATTTRIRNVGGTSFQIRLQEEENADGSHADETVHFIAIDTGTSTLGDQGISVGSTGRAVSHSWYTVDFPVETSNPVFFTGMQSAYGGDTATTRYNNLTSSNVQVQVDEEASRDSELSHTTESVGWMVIGNQFIDSDGDGVQDSADQCPGTLMGTLVDITGCALDLDEDNDGVNDSVDACPNTPAGVEVDSVGCEVIQDQDDDGVADADDLCPNSLAGSTVDADGCPVVANAVALSGAMSASSEFQAAALAVDDNMATRWESTHGEDPSWLSIDLGEQYNLSHVDIFWEAANADTYQIQGSNDNSSWVTLATYTGGAFGARSDTLQLLGTYRYVRMYGTVRSAGNQWGYSIYEFDLYGEQPDDDGNGGGPIDPPPIEDADGDGVEDALDLCPLTPVGTIVDSDGCPVEVLGDITPLFDVTTPMEQAVQYDRGDALVTRISDRARDRHAREDEYQSYDHYLTFYWENRTATIEIVDYVAKGGDSIEMTMVTQWPLETFDNRWWYYGVNTVAEYHDNSGMTQIGPNTYYKTQSTNYREGGAIQVGQKMEFEPSQFLQLANLPRGRDNYYGTTYLYIVGKGLVPYGTTDTGFVQGGPRYQEDSFELPEATWMGGETTLPYNFTNEPDNHFLQMATNLSSDNGQPFVLGRRVHHSSMVDGQHDENEENGVFDDMVALADGHYINQNCSGCHIRNGRASVEDIGVSLDKWVFKIGDASGNPDPARGAVLQPNNLGIDPAAGEGSVSIASWTESNGLRSPNYAFTSGTPATFSGRIAPNIYGVGLLEGVPESQIIALADPDDTNGDGISGRVSKVIDPDTNDIRLGRFGYKAAAFSVKHQVASAFNTDLGVMTNMLPTPDCGSAQTECGDSGAEIADEQVDLLVKYVALLGVRPQRDYDDADVVAGQQHFSDAGCAACHTPTLSTSDYTELAEVRSQTFHPYTDLLLHDMGPGLADNLGEGEATGAEWRTAPLWGVGLSACVTGGVIDPGVGGGDEYCAPDANFLHDGRARTVDEAIRWHGGEGQNANDAYQALSAAQQAQLVRFVESL